MHSNRVITKNFVFLVFMVAISLMSNLLAESLELPISRDLEPMKERFRPQFHFTPEKNFMNDPNGLVYHNEGFYHLFYQYNPFDNIWGHMSWGHAISSDLCYWKHLRVALQEEDGIMIFSGSAVSLPNNQSLVSIYTGDNERDGLQTQNIAISSDGPNFETWKKYENNPVLDIGMKNFRDPKVFWNKKIDSWTMIVVLSLERKVQFYSSKNLTSWNLLSEFGPLGRIDGIWECPDLIPLPVFDGRNRKKIDEELYVLLVSLGTGYKGGSVVQYFIGHFNGREFHALSDWNTNGYYRFVDFGSDFYAATTYNHAESVQPFPVMIGWINNWIYANVIPTDPWRGMQSLPRQIYLLKIYNNSDNQKSYQESWDYLLVQQPLSSVMQKLVSFNLTHDAVVLRGNQEVQLRFERSTQMDHEIDMRLADMNFTFFFNSTKTSKARFGLLVRAGPSKKEYTRIEYNVAQETITIDRKLSGLSDFDSSLFFLKNQTADVIFPDHSNDYQRKLDLRIVSDWSSLECFINNGLTTLTTQIFPDDRSSDIHLYISTDENDDQLEPTVEVRDIHVNILKSIW